MKHDLIINMDIDFPDYHSGEARCRRCGEYDSYLCCDDSILNEDCPSGQLELLDTELSLLV
jgi:hypothetical protein